MNDWNAKRKQFRAASRMMGETFRLLNEAVDSGNIERARAIYEERLPRNGPFDRWLKGRAENVGKGPGIYLHGKQISLEEALEDLGMTEEQLSAALCGALRGQMSDWMETPEGV